jgi:type IV secretory pathway protease TraF
VEVPKILLLQRYCLPIRPFANLTLIALFGRYINPTSSVPRGIYHLFQLTQQPIRHGVLIDFTQPPWDGVPMEHPYDAKRLLKYTAAMPGDIIEENKSGVWINGHKWPNSDPRNLQLRPYIIGRHVVPLGAVWALGTNHNSIDSRYFGDVPIASIEHTDIFDRFVAFPMTNSALHTTPIRRPVPVTCDLIQYLPNKK